MTSLISALQLKQLIKSNQQFKLLYSVLSKKTLTEKEEQILNTETFIDQRQQLISLYDLSAYTKKYPRLIPSHSKFINYLANKNIDQNDNIVIFDRTLYISCRLWWIFKYFGMKNVAILNGGFQQWRIQTNQNQKNIEDTEMQAFDFSKIQQNNQQIMDLKQILQYAYISKQKLEKQTFKNYEFIDARPKEIFELNPIPGFKNIHFEQFLQNDGTFKSQVDLEYLFKDQNIDLQKNIVTSCQTGKVATVINVALDILGKNSYLFDGSYIEYQRNQELDQASIQEIKNLK